MKKVFIIMVMFLMSVTLISCNTETTETDTEVSTEVEDERTDTEPEIADDGIPTRDSINVSVSTTYIDESFNNLMDEADLVIEAEFQNFSEVYLDEIDTSDDEEEATVEAVEPEYTAYTDANFTVTETIEGEIISDEIVVRLHQGYYEDDQSQTVYDINTEYVYEFEEGKTYLLFLNELHNDQYDLIQGSFGYYKVEEDSYINNNKVEGNIER